MQLRECRCQLQRTLFLAMYQYLCQAFYFSHAIALELYVSPLLVSKTSGIMPHLHKYSMQHDYFYRLKSINFLSSLFPSASLFLCLSYSCSHSHALMYSLPSRGFEFVLRFYVDMAQTQVTTTSCLYTLRNFGKIMFPRCIFYIFSKENLQSLLHLQAF